MDMILESSVDDIAGYLVYLFWGISFMRYSGLPGWPSCPRVLCT